MDPNDLVADIVRLCQVNAVLDSQDLSLCNKYGQALVDLTRQEAHETLQANDGRPVMLVYICDGWSARVRSDHRRQDQSGQKIVRQGRSRQEFLLQRGILRVGSAGRGEKLHMLFSAPRALHLGKTSWNVGRAEAHQLCREYCRRGELFYQLWVESDCGVDEFDYCDEHIAEYVEDIEWLDFMIGLPTESTAFGRGMELRRLVPRVGPVPAAVP